jgi:hypothetical protein
MSSAIATQHRLRVLDVSGQKQADIFDAHPDSTVGELIQEMLPQMNLPETDVAGRPLVYHARLEREGRHLHASERIGDALLPDDSVVLLPNIDAGRGDR